MKLRTAAVACLAHSLLLAAAVASAGVVIEFESTSGRSATPTKGTAQLESDRVRMEADGQTVIYRGDKQVVWYLQPQERSYMELSKKDMRQMSDMMAQAQAQLAALPPEQRAMVEKMMAQQMGGMAQQAPKATRTVRNTGKKETINGYACTAYEVLADGKVVEEAWVTSWTQFGLTASDFQALEQLGEFMRELTSPLAKNMDSGLFASYSDKESPDALPGVPVRVINFSGGQRSTYELKKVARQDVPASQFEVPAGLSRRDMMQH